MKTSFVAVVIVLLVGFAAAAPPAGEKPTRASETLGACDYQGATDPTLRVSCANGKGCRTYKATDEDGKPTGKCIVWNWCNATDPDATGSCQETWKTCKEDCTLAGARGDAETTLAYANTNVQVTEHGNGYVTFTYRVQLDSACGTNAGGVSHINIQDYGDASTCSFFSTAAAPAGPDGSKYVTSTLAPTAWGYFNASCSVNINVADADSTPSYSTSPANLVAKDGNGDEGSGCGQIDGFGLKCDHGLNCEDTNVNKEDYLEITIYARAQAGDGSISVANKQSTACYTSCIKGPVCEACSQSSEAVLEQHVTCNGGSDGSVTASVTGGWEPSGYDLTLESSANTYTQSLPWAPDTAVYSHTFDSVVAGVYTLTAGSCNPDDATDCVNTTGTVEVKQPLPLTLQAPNVQDACGAGATGQVTVQTGTYPGGVAGDFTRHVTITLGGATSATATSPSLTGLGSFSTTFDVAPGAHTLTAVDDQDCATAADTNFDVYRWFLGEVTTHDAICANDQNGSVTATFSGRFADASFTLTKDGAAAGNCIKTEDATDRFGTHGVACTGLGAGNYKLTLSSNGACGADIADLSRTFTIKQPLPLTLQAPAVINVCSAPPATGQVTVQTDTYPGGVDGDFTRLVTITLGGATSATATSPSLTGLGSFSTTFDVAPGAHTLTAVDDQDCATAADTNFDVYRWFLGEVTTQNPACVDAFDGSISASFSGGPAASFTLTNDDSSISATFSGAPGSYILGASGIVCTTTDSTVSCDSLQAASYTLTLDTTGACAADISRTFVLSDPPAFTSTDLGFATKTNGAGDCEVDTFTFKVAGGSCWSPSYTPTSAQGDITANGAGSYTLTSNSSCNTTTFTIQIDDGCGCTASPTPYMITQSFDISNCKCFEPEDPVGCTNPGGCDDPPQECTRQDALSERCQDLTAGQHTVIGSVCTFVEEGSLGVTYDVSECAALLGDDAAVCSLQKVHVDFVTSLGAATTAPFFNGLTPVPGQMRYHGDALGGDKFTVWIPLEHIPFDCTEDSTDKAVYLFTHAETSRTTSGTEGTQEDTAFAGSGTCDSSTELDCGNRWYFYMPITLGCNCEPENEDPTPSPSPTDAPTPTTPAPTPAPPQWHCPDRETAWAFGEECLSQVMNDKKVRWGWVSVHNAGTAVYPYTKTQDVWAGAGNGNNLCSDPYTSGKGMKVGQITVSRASDSSPVVFSFQSEQAYTDVAVAGIREAHLHIGCTPLPQAKGKKGQLGSYTLAPGAMDYNANFDYVVDALPVVATSFMTETAPIIIEDLTCSQFYVAAHFVSQVCSCKDSQGQAATGCAIGGAAVNVLPVSASSTANLSATIALGCACAALVAVATVQFIKSRRQKQHIYDLEANYEAVALAQLPQVESAKNFRTSSMVDLKKDLSPAETAEDSLA